MINPHILIFFIENQSLLHTHVCFIFSSYNNTQSPMKTPYPISMNRTSYLCVLPKYSSPESTLTQYCKQFTTFVC